MKNYRFPSSASRSNRPFIKLTKVRVALLFALIAALSCLPFYVFAQNDGAVSTKKSRILFRPF